MEIELDELMKQLQGHWKLDNDEQHFEIKGNEMIIQGEAPVVTSFQLVRNIQLRNWQIKVLKPMSWLRTFIVEINPDNFTLYDFNLTVQMAMGARSKLLNPNRVFKYTRVTEPVAL